MITPKKGWGDDENLVGCWYVSGIIRIRGCFFVSLCVPLFFPGGGGVGISPSKTTLIYAISSPQTCQPMQTSRQKFVCRRGSALSYVF